MPLTRLPLIITLSLCAAPLAGQEKADSSRKDTTAVNLTPIEVVGSIQPSAAPNVISGVPARVTILDGAQVDKYEPRILSDVLAQQAGFSLYDDAGAPYKLNLSSRGFFSSPVVGLPQGLSVFLDGVRQNEPDAAQVNFELLPMQYIRRIELLSGTASLLGRNSLGGSINLVTQRGDGPVGGELELQGGSFGTVNGNGSVSGGSPGGIDYFVGGGFDRADGWRQDTRDHQYNGFLNLGKLTERSGIRLQVFGATSYARTAGSLPATVFDIKPDSNLTPGDYEDLDLVQVAVAGYQQLGLGRGSFRTWFRRSTAQRFNGNQPSDPDALGTSNNRTFGYAADYRWAKPVGASVLSLRGGLDGSVNTSRIELFADSTKFGGPVAQTTLVESPLWDVAAFASGDLTAGRATFSLGARYDYIRIPFHNRLDATADTTSSYSRFSPKGGVSIDLGGAVSVYGSIGVGFRAPALIEVACADPNQPCVLPFSLGDDPPIKPVTTTTYEVGGRARHGGLALAASAYWSEVRNDIFLFPSPNPVNGSTIEGFFGNIDRTRRQGVELTASLGFGNGHSVYANYALTRATFRSAADIFSVLEDSLGSNTVAPGDHLPLVPEHQLKFGATLRLPAGFTVDGDGRYTGSQWLRSDEANQTTPLGGYFVADAKVSWELGRWEITGLVNNVFDKHYANFGSYNVNQGNPAGDTIEQFLTPGQTRQFRLVVRRSFGGWKSEAGAAEDRD